MGAALDRPRTAVYEIPTDERESDGTLAWDATTVVVVQVGAGGCTGMGWSYAPAAAAAVVSAILADVVEGRDAFAVTGTWQAMVAACRNAGRPGVVSHAISAVDVALWDLKARLMGASLVDLLGPVRDGVEAYGSGGFTSYDEARLVEQAVSWVELGLPRIKMKVGRRPADDPGRVAAVRRAIGDAELFVDANGALDRKGALAAAQAFGDLGVSWFEEPVSSDDLEGLRLLRDRAPAGMEIAAGEYGYDLFDFRLLLEAGAVDVLQADATRCGGITGFLRAATLCRAHCVPLSAHTAPSLHAHPGCADTVVRHVEFFHDHVRIERMLFEGGLDPRGGRLCPDRTSPGHGMSLRNEDALRAAGVVSR